MLLKRRTPQNIVIGGAAGATPPVIGWAAAAAGTIESSNPFDLGSAIPWMLFMLIFLWTPPHFWSLAIHKVEDYKEAEVPMLPVQKGIPFTKQHILLYTVLLMAVSLL